MKPVKLNLSRHCIQTEIKRLYNKTVSDYFNKKTGKQDLEEKIEFLKNALESFDFQKLRSRYTELAGGRDDDVYLEIDPDGQIAIKVNEVLIQNRSVAQRTLKNPGATDLNRMALRIDKMNPGKTSS